MQTIAKTNKNQVHFEIGEIFASEIESRIYKQSQTTRIDKIFEKGFVNRGGGVFSPAALSMACHGKYYDETVFFLKVVVQGNFALSGDSRFFDTVLSNEAQKILLSYLRSVIISVCSASNITPIVIGLLDPSKVPDKIKIQEQISTIFD